MGIIITMEETEEREIEVVEMTKKEVRNAERVLAQVRLPEEGHRRLPLRQEETSRNLLPLRVLITQRAVAAQSQTIQTTRINLNRNQSQSQSRTRKTQRVEALIQSKRRFILFLNMVNYSLI